VGAQKENLRSPDTRCINRRLTRFEYRTMTMSYETQIRRLAAYPARKAEAETQPHAANLAHERFASFQPEISGNFRCPRCWIEHQTRSVLAAVPHTKNAEGSFSCHTCSFDLFLPFSE